jgi:hypothetical protein
MRPAGEFLEPRELLSTAMAKPGGGLGGDPPDPPDPGDRPPKVHTTVVDEDPLTHLSVTQWDQNQPYSGMIANFGSPQARLAMVSGLPAGLEATKSGNTIILSGTPTQTGPFDIGVETEDQDDNNNSRTFYVGTYTLTINPMLSLSGLSAFWTAGQAGFDRIAVSGGTPQFSNLAVTGLPPGLTAALSAGAITLSGTPTQAGTFGQVAVSLQDSTGATVQQTYSIPVGLGLNPGILPADTAGQSYRVTMSATGGSGHYNFTVASGALPAGLSLSPAGLLSGTATGPASPAYQFSIRATDTVNPGVSGTWAYTMAVNPAAVSHLVISVPATVSAHSSFPVIVTALDPYGDGVNNIPITLGGKTVLTSYGLDGHGPGTAAFNLVAPTSAGTYTLTATAPGVAAATITYTVGGAYPRWIDIRPATTTPVAGVPFNVTLTLQDPWGNTSDYYGSVTLISSDGQLAPMTVTAVHGTVIVPITLNLAHSLTLTAVYGPLTQGTSGTITVQPGAPAQLIFLTQPPSTVVAGTPFKPVVEVEDRSGNPTPGVSVNMSISPGMLSSGTTPVPTGPNGQAAFSLTEKQAGSYVLNASVAGLGSVASHAFTVLPGQVASVTLTPSTTTPTAGMPFTVTVTAKDAFGNGWTGAATLTSSDGLPQMLQLSGGSTMARVTLTKAHAVTLTATADGIKGSASVVVSPAATAKLVLSSTATTGFTGDHFTVTVSAQDRFGNPTNYSGTATLNSSNSQIVSATTIPVRNGTGQLPLTMNHSGQVTLSLSAGSLQSTRVTINVTATLWYYSWEFFAEDDNGVVIQTYDYIATNPLNNEPLAFSNDALAANDRDVHLQLWAHTLTINWYQVGWEPISKIAAN